VSLINDCILQIISISPGSVAQEGKDEFGEVLKINTILKAKKKYSSGTSSSSSLLLEDV
jgi:hypothetical protein